MKIVVLERDFENVVDAIAQSRIMADSAMVVAGRPLFLPDFSKKWKARIYVAYRVSRLGKSVKSKFAYRYYDACSLALRLIPVDSLLDNVQWFADNSIALSPFIEISEGQENPHLSFENLSFRHSPQQIASAIEQITTFSTIRNGDLILLGFKEIETDIVPRIDFRGIIGENHFTISLR